MIILFFQVRFRVPYTQTHIRIYHLLLFKPQPSNRKKNQEIKSPSVEDFTKGNKINGYSEYYRTHHIHNALD